MVNQSENHASYKGKMVKLSVVRVHGIKTLSALFILTSNKKPTKVCMRAHSKAGYMDTIQTSKIDITKEQD